MENKVIINLDEYLELKEAVDYYIELLDPLGKAAQRETELTGYDPYCIGTKKVMSIDENLVCNMLKKLWECDEVRIIRKGE